MEAVEPRSTWSHCGSENALDQRVPVLPSTAAEAGKDAFSSDDAVAGWPCDSSVEAALARLAGLATKRAAMSAATTERIQIRWRASDRNACIMSKPMRNPCLREVVAPSGLSDLFQDLFHNKI